MDENINLQGFEVLSPEVKSLIEKLHFTLSASEVNTQTVQDLDYLKQDAMKLLKQAVIDSMSSKFKKDIISSIYDNSLAYINMTMLYKALDTIEQNEKFKDIVSYILTFSPYVDLTQGSYYIDINFYLTYKYENETYILEFAKLSYKVNEKEDLLLYIGSYSHPVIKISLTNERENSENSIKDQLKGLFYLIDTYEDKLKRRIGES